MKHRIILCVAFTAAMLTGCRAPKDITYLQGWENAQSHTSAPARAIVARTGDKLSIVVSTDNPMLSEMLNLNTYSHRLGVETFSNNQLETVSQSQIMSFYTVDSKGDINFPMLGPLHVEGLTREQIADLVTRRLVEGNVAKNPVVIVELANAAVTVAGEVTKPGRYNLQRDVTTITDILGQAGDLTIQGKRDNVLVVRTEDGKTMSYRVDLTNGETLLQSPVYYLQQNDYVYVEPNNVKKRQATVNGNNVLSTSFWISIASLMTTIAVLVFR